MSDTSTRVQTFLKKRNQRNALPLIIMGVWVGSFLMALASDTLLTVDGGLGKGGKGNLIFVIVLAVVYLVLKSVLNKQLAELQKGFTPEDRQALLREIVGD